MKRKKKAKANANFRARSMKQSTQSLFDDKTQEDAGTVAMSQGTCVQRERTRLSSTPRKVVLSIRNNSVYTPANGYICMPL